MGSDSPFRLALAIPTFNRPSILAQNLEAMLPELRRHRIPVYVSDDSPGPETEIAVREIAAAYDQLHYSRNTPSLGHDGNFFRTVQLPDADYVWYLGDSVFIRPGALDRIVPLLDFDVDFCFVNSYAPGDAVDFVQPSGMHDFLLTHAWYLTLSGATIYGRRPRSLAAAAESTKNWKNFPQLGLILEYCASFRAGCYWYGPNAIGIRSNKRSYWANRAFDVFVGDWSRLIKSYPRLFSEEEAVDVIRSHAQNTGLFGLRHLLWLRAHGGLDSGILRKFDHEFSDATPISPVFARLICALPQSLLETSIRIVRATRS